MKATAPLFGRAALAFAVAAISFPSELPGAGHAVILQYHHIADDTPPSTSVSPRLFESHLEYLEQNGFSVWSVERIVDALREGRELPEKCVGITIDDAYRSVAETAFPILESYGYPFTVFVTTEGVDRGFRSYMTWDQMRKMKSSGAVFAAHGHSHGYLVRRRDGESEEEWSRRVRDDIAVSVRRLEEELGSSSALFAYPYGEYDNALRGIVRSLGLVGFGQHSGALWKGSDFLALPRFPLSAGYAGMARFAEKVGSLPLPVLSAEPADPVLPAGVSRPVLSLKIGPGDYRRETLACFAGGLGRIPARWVEPGGQAVEVVAGEPLPRGRSLYTCTARHRSEQRYYWYSHLWIRN